MTLRCELCDATAEEVSRHSVWFLTAPPNEQYDAFALCSTCITPYAKCDRDSLEHTWHTVCALASQAMIDELDIKQPKIINALMLALRDLSDQIRINAESRALLKQRSDKS